MRNLLKPAVAAMMLAIVACGSSSPTQPSTQPPPASPPTTPAPPAPLTLAGTLTATNGGRTLAGITVAAGSAAGATDSAGRYSLSFPAGTVGLRFTVSGPGVVTHTGFFANGESRTVDLDAFSLDGFDPSYFKAIVRNGWEAPTSLQPLRRWTRSPQLYIRTVDDTGRAILPEVLQQVVNIATSVVPLYTGGRLAVASIVQGTETRQGQAGWITVVWTRDAEDFCGTSHVGQEGGVVTLTYDQPGCSCGSQKIRARTVKHEFGHAMGLWHSGQGVDLMSGLGVSECDRNMTARELQYLDYLYRRPVGNTDPDNDPGSAPRLTMVRALN